MSLINRFLTAQGAFILDGALATELERRGCDINDPLWSAKILLEAPELIKQVHLDYLYAGADCIITATYQATFEGLTARGLSHEDATKIILLAVDLAIEARDDFWNAFEDKDSRLKPLVAASVGPYGAYLANGAEYTGEYGLTQAQLTAWHRPRWQLLSRSAADLLACETIPSRVEALAYRQLLEEFPKEAWLTFSCRDGNHISDGTLLHEVLAEVQDSPLITAVGINCTAPRFLPSLIREAQKATRKPILVYPNSGETYDVVEKKWLGQSDAESFGTAGREWRKIGAAGIGGCCRTTPKHIRAISDRLRRSPPLSPVRFKAES
ncbi:MAG: homocysteine S-methyltransferase [Ardenticatenaceae bacterium]|nr:homocysteine S-methyltransferase [Ardenticatenaceae bacterium]